MRVRLNGYLKTLLDAVVRLAPVAFIVVVASYYTAKQIATPHHRMIKMGVLGAMLVFMFRFDLIYSLFAFTILFPFPSGITIGSTNSVMMTLIVLAWFIRATSTRQRVNVPTRYDWALAVLVLGYILSFYNCDNTTQVVRGLHVVWKQLAALAYFYGIMLFVNDEKRLAVFTRVVGAMLGLVIFTGVIELFAPGSKLIPGWFSLPELKGKGSITFRVEGVRLGGAVGGHNILSDMGAVGLFIMTMLALRARNPLERFLWVGGAVSSVAVLMGTANRGAFISLALALLYTLFWYARRISFPKLVMIVTSVIVLFAVMQVVLDRFTYAVSLTDRLVSTKMQGLTPDTRVGVWKPAFMKSLEHPLVGHGPWYDPGYGLTFQYWPHNAYIYYFYTIGLVGAGAFIWICWLLVRRSMIFRRRGVWGTRLGDMSAIFHILLMMILFGQLRTDHQRDEVNMYLMWLLFALVATTANIIDRGGKGPDDGQPTLPS